MAITTILREVTPVSNLYGMNNNPIWHGIEVAGSTWKKGALLINSGGSLAISGDEPTAGTVIGVALSDATGVTGADAAFSPALPGIIFEASLDISGALGTGTVAQSNIWTWFNWSLDAGTGRFFVDVSESDVGGALLIGVKQGVVLGTTIQPRVYVTFSGHALTGNNAGVQVW